jgi:hypothetical protein
MSFVENVNILANAMSPATMSKIQIIIDTVIPNLQEILQADNNAKIAIEKAAEATADVELIRSDIKNVLDAKAGSAFTANSFIVALDCVIPNGMSAITIGDSDGVVTINGGVTVTISPKSKWVVM